LGLDRLYERIDSNEFFVSFVACVFLIRFRVPIGSGQNHARYPVGQFHLKPVHKTFYTKQTKETKNVVLHPFRKGRFVNP
jgi:hypothetical protein